MTTPTLAATQEYLEKATFTTGDLSGGSNGGRLSPGQSQRFLKVAVEYTAILREARVEFLPEPIYQVPRLAFNSRVMRAGAEAQRLADANRAKPTTGMVELTTSLLKGEVPISDEALEDNIERAAFIENMMDQLTERIGFDIEELGVKGDVARVPADPDYEYLHLNEGIVKLCQTNLPTAQKINCTGLSSPEACFKAALTAMPAKYRRNYNELRFFVPVPTRDAYIDSLSARGTGLGDQAISDDVRTRLAYHGIQVIEVPALSGTDTINGGSTDYGKFGFLFNPQNLIVGFHRRVRIETYRDPRDGATSVLPSCRVDFEFADPQSVVLLYNIPTFS